jgi:hypothetical protein
MMEMKFNSLIVTLPVPNEKQRMKFQFEIKPNRQKCIIIRQIRSSDYELKGGESIIQLRESKH